MRLSIVMRKAGGVIDWLSLDAVSGQDPTPENRNVENVVRALFTPYITKTMCRVTTNEV